MIDRHTDVKWKWVFAAVGFLVVVWLHSQATGWRGAAETAIAANEVTKRTLEVRDRVDERVDAYLVDESNHITEGEFTELDTAIKKWREDRSAGLCPASCYVPDYVLDQLRVDQAPHGDAR